MMLLSALTLFLSVFDTAQGFLTPPAIGNSFKIAQKDAFFVSTKTKTQLFGGPPQYEKKDAVLKEAEIVANDSVMLHFDTVDVVDYKPGHVMALEMQNTLDLSLSEKNEMDASRNDGWLRGPYTVSRSSEKSFDILIKVVGNKSEILASSEPGTEFKFGGQFKVPILDGIDTKSTNRVVFISTGVGVGPFVGAIEDAMKDEEFPPIELYACYRTTKDVIVADYLDQIAEQNPDKLSWKSIISSDVGRISTEENAKMICSSSNDSNIESTHFHLIGNGQMVKEWKEGLAQAGIPEDKVTVEMYFNGMAEPDSDAIKSIAGVISENLNSVSAPVA